MGFVKVDGGRDVNIRQTVTIGEAEALFPFEIGRQRFRRPPVKVFSPVSTRVTRQFSALWRWKCTVLSDMSNDRSDM
jgi:hypothetical protein